MHQTKLQTLLENPRQAGIYHLPDSGQGAIKEAASAAGFACFALDFADSDRLEVVLDNIARDLGFPEWYGRNLDALKDCLTDLSWSEASGYVLIVSRAEPLHSEALAAFRALNQVFLAAIEDWRTQDCFMWVFYDLRPDGLALLPTLV
jgi:hypothetical protein